MPCLLSATQDLCTYYLSRDEINTDDIRGTLIDCLNVTRNGALKYDKYVSFFCLKWYCKTVFRSFYLNLIIYAKLRLPPDDFAAEFNLSDDVLSDIRTINNRMVPICSKTSRGCEICAEIETNLQRQSFSDLLM